MKSFRRWITLRYKVFFKKRRYTPFCVFLQDMIDILKSSLSFPISFYDDISLIKIEQSVLDFDVITFNNDDIIINDGKDLSTVYKLPNHRLNLIVPILKDLQEELLLDKFSSIRIYKYNLLILEIKLINNTTRRHVRLDLDCLEDNIRYNNEINNIKNYTRVVAILCSIVFTVALIKIL